MVVATLVVPILPPRARTSHRQVRLFLSRYTAKPRLTLAMSATIALATAFLVDHRVAAALWTEVAGHTRMAQVERRGSIIRTIAIAILCDDYWFGLAHIAHAVCVRSFAFFRLRF